MKVQLSNKFVYVPSCTVVNIMQFYRQGRYKASSPSSVTSKKSPNVYKSCPKMISLEKLKILTPFQKLPKNVGDFGQNNYCQRFWKVAQSPKNRHDWSHCLHPLKTSIVYFSSMTYPKRSTSLSLSLSFSLSSLSPIRSIVS